MEDAREYFLGSAEAKNLTKEYRKKLKKEECSLIIRNKGQEDNQNHLSLSFEIRGEYYYDNASFHLQRLSQDVVHLYIISTCEKASLTDVIDYAVGISKRVGAMLLVIEINENTKTEKNISDIEAVNTLPLSRVGFRFLINAEEKLNYINLMDNYAENMFEVADVLEKLVQEQKKLDETATYTLETFKQEPNIFIINYYKNGLKGTFALECRQEILFYDKNLDHRDVIKTPADLQKSFKELMEKIETETKFSSLISPPREHFSQFFQKKFGSNFNWKNEYIKEVLVDNIFDLLSEHQDPKELELLFYRYNKNHVQSMLDEPEGSTYRKIDEQEYIQIFELLSTYFVVDFRSGNTYKYENTDLAYEGYRKAVLKKIRDNYTKKINEFEHRVQQLK